MPTEKTETLRGRGYKEISEKIFGRGGWGGGH